MLVLTAPGSRLPFFSPCPNCVCLTLPGGLRKEQPLSHSHVFYFILLFDRPFVLCLLCYCTQQYELQLVANAQLLVASNALYDPHPTGPPY